MIKSSLCKLSTSINHAKNYYRVLNIDPHAKRPEIRQAYIAQAKICHPDTLTGSTEKFKDILEAWEILGDESLREKYDKSYFRMQSSYSDFMKNPHSSSHYSNPFHSSRTSNSSYSSSSSHSGSSRNTTNSERPRPRHSNSQQNSQSNFALPLILFSSLFIIYKLLSLSKEFLSPSKGNRLHSDPRPEIPPEKPKPRLPPLQKKRKPPKTVIIELRFSSNN